VLATILFFGGIVKDSKLQRARVSTYFNIKPMHGYSNTELIYRCEPTNHKILYDGFSYRWFVKIDNTWEIQSIILYETYKTAYAHIKFWLSKYNKEMNNRNNAEAVKEYFSKMEDEAIKDKKLYEIVREYDIKTKEKIIQMMSLKPNISSNRISELLHVSIRSVERHRKSLNINYGKER